MRIFFGTASIAAVAMALVAAPAAAQAPWSVSGQLQDGDSVGEEERRYDDHRIRLDAGQRYRISVNSEAFDPVARLYRPGGTEMVAENDDAGGSLNSRINYTAPAGGDYVLRVTGFATDARGAYTAEAAPIAPPPPPVSAPGTPTPVTGTWMLWQGELGPSDPDRDGHRYDDYLIRVAAGQTRYISLEAQGFDALIQVLRVADLDSDPIETVDGDDDAGAGLNALVAFAPAEAGDYVVRVTSFAGEATGRYRLWVSE